MRPDVLGDPGPDTLRASLVGRELVATPAGGRRNLLIEGDWYGTDRLPSAVSTSKSEIKAALCYAHEVVLEDPFDEEQDVVGFMVESREWMPDVSIRLNPDPDWFIGTVSTIAELGSLIRQGVVGFVSRRVGMDPRNAGRKVSNAWDAGGETADKVAREVASRMLRTWFSSDGSIVPMFASDAEQRAFEADLGLFGSILNKGESTRLRRLTRLALPNADNLALSDMIELRNDDLFERFRSRQRQALGMLGPDDEDVPLFRAEMRAAAAELSTATPGRRFARSLSPRLVGWGIGSLAVGMFDWRMMVAALSAGAGAKAAELVSSTFAQSMSDRGVGQRALRQHYAVLGAAPS